MVYYAKTHIGNVRRNNEDAYYVPNDAAGFLVIVADGMGGHNAGEVASNIVISTLADMLGAIKPEKITEDTVRSVFAKANARVLADAASNPERSGMGSTATAAVLCGGKVMIGHVGDSRAYIFHNRLLKQITQDHSYVQMLIDLGYITEQEADGHPQKNMITRAMGMEHELITDIYYAELAPCDCLLLCTDGLNAMVRGEQIAMIMGEGYDTAAERLIEAARDAGGVDNVTVVLACLEGEL